METKAEKEKAKLAAEAEMKAMADFLDELELVEMTADLKLLDRGKNLTAPNVKRQEKK